jgi:hypothetical protein
MRGVLSCFLVGRYGKEVRRNWESTEDELVDDNDRIDDDEGYCGGQLRVS